MARTTAAWAAPVRPLAAAGVAALLLAALLGGLQRAGWAPWPQLAVAASVSHGALMVGGWLGTVIALERAVALKTRLAWAAPALSALGGAALASGHFAGGDLLLCGAAAAFTATGAQLLRRQRAVHHGVMILAGAAWLAGNAGAAWGAAHDAVLAAWFAFLVLTIAAERLEMTRLLRRHPAAQPAFLAIVALLLGGVALAYAQPAAGLAIYGTALVALAAWLATQDIARITVRQHGLPRYMAVALWLGYGWLAFGGVAWLGMAFGCPGREAAVHALGLGFVISMVMAHAPVIVPALARVKLRFSAAFYAPLALLHLSLAWRLAVDLPSGALLNAAAFALFALTAAGAALAARR